MTYATYQDFLNFYQTSISDELGHIDNESLGREEERITQALTFAYGEINQILSVRYQLPIVIFVPFLAWSEIVIARKNLASYDITEKVRQDYDDVILRLREIISNGGRLVDVTGQDLPEKIIISEGNKHSMYSGDRGKFAQSINFPKGTYNAVYRYNQIGFSRNLK